MNQVLNGTEPVTTGNIGDRVDREHGGPSTSQLEIAVVQARKAPIIDIDRPQALAGLFERDLFLPEGVAAEELATLEAEGAGGTDTPHAIMPRGLGRSDRGRQSSWGRARARRRWALAPRFVGARVGGLLLWLRQGMRAEVHEVLAPIYGWFTEGFDTADLKEAKALLEELG